MFSNLSRVPPEQVARNRQRIKTGRLTACSDSVQARALTDAATVYKYGAKNPKDRRLAPDRTAYPI
jgi:hypothetical protein